MCRRPRVWSIASSRSSCPTEKETAKRGEWPHAADGDCQKQQAESLTCQEPVLQVQFLVDRHRDLLGARDCSREVVERGVLICCDASF